MRIRLCLAAVTVLAIPAAIAQAAPSAGVYHGVVNGSTAPPPCHGNEGEGFFRLKAGDVVPANDFTFCGSPAYQAKILAPSSFTCNDLNATVSTPSIPVQGGSFKYKGQEPVGNHGAANRTVIFKGTWDTNSKVTGTTRIKGGGCDHTDKWTMKKL